MLCYHCAGKKNLCNSFVVLMWYWSYEIASFFLVLDYFSVPFLLWDGQIFSIIGSGCFPWLIIVLIILMLLDVFETHQFEVEWEDIFCCYVNIAVMCKIQASYRVSRKNKEYLFMFIFDVCSLSYCWSLFKAVFKVSKAENGKSLY